MKDHVLTSANRNEEVNRLLGVFCHLTAVTLLVVTIAFRLYYKHLHLSRDFEFDKLAILAVATALIVVGLSTRVLPGRLALAMVSTLTALGIGLVGCVFLSIDVAASVKQAITTAVFRSQKADIFQQDERYGYRLRPNAQGRDRAVDYDVLMTVDASGHRITPTPAESKRTVIIAGDSFTFGDGVADHEAYPYILGAQYWRQVKVVNAGVSGWGPTQSYLAVQDALEHGPAPSMVAYEMIPDVIFRSYLRQPVTRGVGRRLEFVDGQFVSRTPDATVDHVEITPELIEKEIHLTRDLVIAMATDCKRRNVPFVVLLMQDNGRFPPSLIYDLGVRNVPIVDLTRLTYERFVHDYHPNAADHRRIAKAVVDSRETAMLYEAAAVPRPAAVN